jgi:cell division septation protein DedD
MNGEETDITIGPGKLLGLFFMLVVICGVFFAIGYSLGKTSAREQALNDKAPLSASLNAPVVGDASTPKPSAAVTTNTEPDAKPAEVQENTPSAPDLTFFNAVKRTDQSKAATEQKPAEPKPAATPTKGNEAAAVANPASAAVESTTAKSAVAPNAAGEFVVQVAAVTREEDAAALAGALRKKSYKVFVVNNPALHDKFYHVQVGPFLTLQDAESMKTRLTGEGYNPIVKKS